MKFVPLLFPSKRASFFQVTNEDRQRLHAALVSARRALVDSAGLRKPSGDEAGGSFFKNTLRRLSVKKMEKFRAEALANEQGEVYKVNDAH